MFRDVTYRYGKWSLVWESIGEGRSGDYDPEDPTDKPHLRATLLYRGEPVDDGSYCTLATEETGEPRLRALTEDLFRALGRTPASFSRHAMQVWTWRTG